MSKNCITEDEILYRIGYFQNKRNISSYELGQRLGHTKGYFYRIENKEIALTTKMLVEILEILDISSEEFFYSDFENYQQHKDIIESLQYLSTDEIDLMKLQLKQKIKSRKIKKADYKVVVKVKPIHKTNKNEDNW